MAPLALNHSLLLLLLISALATSCNSDTQYPPELVARALLCFNNQNIYRRCEESYQLTAKGEINVPRHAADAYCGGPCLTETELVLNCVDAILSSFFFYNGATTRDVRYTISSACGRGGRRGDFDVLDRIKGYGYYYSQGLRHAAPSVAYLATMISCGFALSLL